MRSSAQHLFLAKPKINLYLLLAIRRLRRLLARPPVVSSLRSLEPRPRRSLNWVRSRFLLFLASDGLGGRIWGHPSPLSKSRSLSNFWLQPRPQKRFFDSPNSTYQLTSSKAAEVNAAWPKTTAPMGRGYMPIFNLLRLLVWPCISFKQQDRIRGPLIHIWRENSNLAWYDPATFTKVYQKVQGIHY